MVDTAERHLPLDEMDKYQTLSEKVSYMHSVIKDRFAAVDRIAIAKYDYSSGALRTYIASTDGENPLILHEAKLHDVPSLLKLVQTRETRVINNLNVLADRTSVHSTKILGSGFRSSYTVPLFHEHQFIGMLFFNSYQPDAFDSSNLTYLDLLAQLLLILLTTELNQIATLRGAVKTATQFTGHRDPETGMHLERMAHYSRLIARQLATAHGIGDEFVDDIFRYAPLHDVGKITIPDAILLKRGPLTDDEREVMKAHTTAGRKIIDAMLQNFKFDNIKNLNMIYSIVTHHHEQIDGKGYPNGLAGENIPLEARIVAVADVFDALTSERPYKRAWSNEHAFVELERLSHFKLDADCVAALIASPEQILEIQSSFAD
jgi:HD-GYP domain-containing protein (c-di-GMP phosphodiesterase class II)